MIQILRKSDQYNTSIFNGNLVANKPVVSGYTAAVAPYSSLFYWSHGIAMDDCEFGLHPHEGFEIMTFILEGNVTHYDTATKVWTPLETGDFQVIQSNSGIQHRERITKGTRSFQIWFDPNFYEAIKEKPAYVDYHRTDFLAVPENGIKTITYVGENSKSFAQTPHLVIKRLILDQRSTHNLTLDKNSSYTVYILKGNGLLDNNDLGENDAIRISDLETLTIEIENGGELFLIQTPLHPDYKTVWN